MNVDFVCRHERTVAFSSVEVADSDWALTPEELVLYCPTGGQCSLYQNVNFETPRLF